MPEAAWYYDNVRYVFEYGLMAGTSNDQFSPDLSITRAMAVTILWRMENTPVSHGSTSFQDLSQSWYIDGVQWAGETGIVSGYSPDCFGPEDPISREQLAVMLYNYTQYKGFNVSDNGHTQSYADAVHISIYALEALWRANSNDLIRGRFQTELAPQGTATRAESAATIHRFRENFK